MDKPILISAGDFAGINPYLLLSRLKHFKDLEFHIAINRETLKKYSNMYGIDIPENLVSLDSEAKIETPVKGRRNKITARAAAVSLNECLNIMKENAKEYAALLTLPVDKGMMAEYINGFRGHTEYIGDYTGSNTAMILYSDDMAVSPVTTHTSIDRVIRELNINSIKMHVNTVGRFYRERMNREPKMLFLCINPHCSDNGILGNADNELSNIVEHMKREYIIRGPISADTAFMPGNREHTDIFICPYHDQALIPFKMIAFDTGINITAGLPFLRLSPDHGPAYELTMSEGLISPGSFDRCIEFVEKGA